jgi:threonine aldolase
MSTPIQHDFRSDTVTRPSPAMRAAMASAEVGDDVFRDDPTVTQLEAVMAERFGKEAAVFLTSGTQSNLVALMAHCERGDEYIVGQQAHCYRWEAGGAAVLGSIQPQPLNNQPDGSLLLAEIEDSIKPDDSHYARTRLLALENTIGGKVLSQEYMEGDGAGASARPRDASGRRAYFQRRDGAQYARCHADALLRYGVRVFIEGIGCAGWFGAGR